MIYASLLGIQGWATTGGSARSASAALAETDGASAALLEVDGTAVLGGNRGTGLDTGSWVMDGGLYWNGVNVDSEFKLFLNCRSISDSQLRGDALDTSLLRGEKLPAGGYRNLVLSYAKVNIGMFNSKNGYYLKQRLCTVAGTCLTQIFLEEGQSKVMIYAAVYGIEAWVTSGGSARRT